MVQFGVQKPGFFGKAGLLLVKVTHYGQFRVCLCTVTGRLKLDRDVGNLSETVISRSVSCDDEMR